MPFDVDLMAKFCSSQIKRFAVDHEGETFYGFAIDAGLLCVNSEEAAAETLLCYRRRWDRTVRPVDSWSDLDERELRDVEFVLSLHEKNFGLDRADQRACLEVINEKRKRDRQRGNPFETTDEAERLRRNTGDWKYQGFAELTDEVGFDWEAYDDHYGLEEDEQETSAYAQAIDALIQRLEELDAFSPLNRGPHFSATRVEHDY